MTRLSGMTAIGAALRGMTARRIHQLAVQAVDPLPLRLLGRTAWILSTYLEQWDARTRDLRRVRRGNRPTLPVVVGRAAIAARAGVTERQVQRWSRLPEDPLPVRGRDRAERLPGGLMWIYDTALRDWLQRHDRPYSERPKRRRR